MSRLRVAIVADYPEEGWASMDLVAEMLLAYLARDFADAVEPVMVCPKYEHRFGRLPTGLAAGGRRNADRLLNRFRDYPRFLRRLAAREPFDAFHVVDHSYAQLVHALPADRTVVSCHDLDAFRSLLRPDLEPRAAWFRVMARRTLGGMRRAAIVACGSGATLDAVRAHGLVPEDRLRLVTYGISPEFLEPPGAEAELEADGLAGPAGPADLLHVGSTIPRKRIDVLLDVVAGVRLRRPEARLIKVGRLTPGQHAQAARLGLEGSIVEVPWVEGRRTLAALYRRAALVLQPSEAEGFGLPLAEAMACGAPILASDLPALRDVAGEAAVYRAVGDVPAWVDAALAMLGDREANSDAHRARLDAGRARSALYRWERHAAGFAAIYAGLAAIRA